MKQIDLINAKVGMIVKLTHPSKQYQIGKRNPKVGTEYECTGILDRINRGSEFTFHVSWSNKHSNSYKENELSLATDTGMYVDFWKEM